MESLLALLSAYWYIFALELTYLCAWTLFIFGFQEQYWFVGLFLGDISLTCQVPFSFCSFGPTVLLKYPVFRKNFNELNLTFYSFLDTWKYVFCSSCDIGVCKAYVCVGISTFILWLPFLSICIIIYLDTRESSQAPPHPQPEREKKMRVS